MTTTYRTAAPTLIRVMGGLLILFGVFAFFGSVFLWGEGFVLTFPEGVNVAFPITDILINAPASIIAGIGLWQMRRYGFYAGLFVAGFYIYASVYIFVETLSGPLLPTGTLLAILIPQTLAVMVAICLLTVLPRQREAFFGG